MIFSEKNSRTNMIFCQLNLDAFTLPFGQEAIHWRLLTTHQVVCLEQALQVIKWYRWRWRIEQLFATLKKAGLNLEATQLEYVTAIQRLTILALGVAVRTLQMVEGRDNSDKPSFCGFLC